MPLTRLVSWILILPMVKRQHWMIRMLRMRHIIVRMLILLLIISNMHQAIIIIDCLTMNTDSGGKKCMLCVRTISIVERIFRKVGEAFMLRSLSVSRMMA